MMENQKKLCSYGPGGYHCSCCGPAPKERKKERRRLRKIFTRMIEQELKQEAKLNTGD